MRVRYIGSRIAHPGVFIALAALGCSAPSGTENQNKVPPYPGSVNSMNPTSLTNVGSSPEGAPNSATGNGSSPVPTANGPVQTNEGKPNLGNVSPITGPGNTAGGTATPSGISGTGVPMGTVPTAHDLNCDGFNIAAVDVISDFGTDQPIMYAVGDRGGTSWRSYAPNGDQSNPSLPGNSFAIDPSQSGPCNSGGALHVSTPG